MSHSDERERDERHRHAEQPDRLASIYSANVFSIGYVAIQVDLILFLLTTRLPLTPTYNKFQICTACRGRCLAPCLALGRATPKTVPTSLQRPPSLGRTPPYGLG